MAMENLSAVNPFVSRPSQGGPTLREAGHQGRVEQPRYSADPRGSLFDGFDVSGWNGAPVYGEDEHVLDFNA